MQNQEGFKVGDHILPSGDIEVYIVQGFYLLSGSPVVEIQPLGGGTVKIAHPNDMKLFTKLHPYRVPLGFVLRPADDAPEDDG